jgi:hypothetical protein
MEKFFWRGVVLEKGYSIVTHLGRSSELVAPTLASAQREIDAIVPASRTDGINCYQIMSEDGRVLSYRIIDPGSGRACWS